VRFPWFSSPDPSLVILTPNEVRVVVYSEAEMRAAIGQLRRLRRTLRGVQRSPDPAVRPADVAARLAQVETVLARLEKRRRGWRRWIPT
jgi:hypothetical protein